MVMAAIRSINTVAEAMPQLTKFSLQAPKLVEVEFADGRVFKLLAEFLRIISPAVDGKIRSIGGNIRETARRNHVCRTGSELWDKSGLCSRQRPLVRRENNCRGARATDGGDNTCDYGLIWVKKMRRRKSSFEEGMNREKVCMTLLTSSATLTLDSYHGSKLMPSLTSLIFG
ncbi:uncharacterized protein LOC130983277 isoform X1 [Arachis stenosperma]|uniref:uncharacterized protein LOC130983277 isoform X1 n=1 Tax=Arachis stenosperma TaxID=217475 RepID=UPI0025AD9978|nr:uncharacterized protein LOC130983277 isoform X1 [Arachis stenosperma]